jgi:hypothetical protein
MSQVTELASGQITAIDTLTIELVQANETPAVVMIRWPAKRPCCIRDCSSPLLTPLPASRCCRRTACSDQAGASAGTLARREVIATGLRATQMHVADLVSTNLALPDAFRLSELARVRRRSSPQGISCPRERGADCRSSEVGCRAWSRPGLPNVSVVATILSAVASGRVVVMALDEVVVSAMVDDKPVPPRQVSVIEQGAILKGEHLAFRASTGHFSRAPKAQRLKGLAATVWEVRQGGIWWVADAICGRPSLRLGLSGMDPFAGRRSIALWGKDPLCCEEKCLNGSPCET